MWALFRVENEHCSNVSQYKASRDVPLPYRIEPLMDHATASVASSPTIASNEHRPGQDPEAQTTGANRGSGPWETLRKRISSTSGARTFTKILAEAHKQDFEKKKPSVDQQAQERLANEGPSDDDDDDSTDHEGEHSDESAEAANYRETQEAGDLVRRAIA